MLEMGISFPRHFEQIGTSSVVEEEKEIVALWQRKCWSSHSEAWGKL
jgi:hypothetical protein